MRRALLALPLAALAVGAVSATAAAPVRTPVGVHIDGRTSLERVVSPTVLVDRGTVTGSPVGSARIRLVYHLRPKAGIATTTFTMVNARGTVSGRITSRYAVTAPVITFTGAGTITGGTGAYRGIQGGPLAFEAVHSVTGRREVVSLTGRATLPPRP